MGHRDNSCDPHLIAEKRGSLSHSRRETGKFRRAKISSAISAFPRTLALTSGLPTVRELMAISAFIGAYPTQW
jgi:hypothetical protein